MTEKRLNPITDENLEEKIDEAFTETAKWMERLANATDPAHAAYLRSQFDIANEYLNFLLSGDATKDPDLDFDELLTPEMRRGIGGQRVVCSYRRVLIRTAQERTVVAKQAVRPPAGGVAQITPAVSGARILGR